MEKKLEKRIKRHVIAKNHNFFAAVSPGFEKVCAQEIKELGLEDSGSETEGGVLFSGRVHELYHACLNIRTANRILMRLGDMKADSFSTLEKKADEFPWELYLDQTPEIKVTTKHCKLYHSDAVAERLEKAITGRLKKNGVSPASKRPQLVLVRGVDDRFLISLDAGGELLYKRGVKQTLSGVAPIRETIAAGILSAAGYDPEKPLLDPMCGSGTFSMEAAMMQTGIPAGWFREFAFFGWPCFKETRWKDIRRNAEKKMVQAASPRIFASDTYNENIQNLEKDLEMANLENTVQTSCLDFYKISADLVPEDKGLVVINPPYGLRVGQAHKIKTMFLEIFSTFKEVLPGWKFAVIAPSKELADAVSMKHDRIPFSHGGLKLLLLTGTIR